MGGRRGTGLKNVVGVLGRKKRKRKAIHDHRGRSWILIGRMLQPGTSRFLSRTLGALKSTPLALTFLISTMCVHILLHIKLFQGKQIANKGSLASPLGAIIEFVAGGLKLRWDGDK